MLISAVFRRLTMVKAGAGLEQATHALRTKSAQNKKPATAGFLRF